MSDTLPYVPGRHVGGSSSELPIGQKEPARHGTHHDAAVAFWYVDAGHRMHVASLCSSEKVPGEHSIGEVEPVPHS